MKFNYRKIFIFIGISITVAMIFCSFWNMQEREKSINENKYETLGVVYKYYSNRSNSRYYYKYVYKNLTFYNDEDLDNFNGEACVNKYYKINLSIKNPEYSKIFLDQEVTDSTEIVNAGFEYK
ncbi:MAG: hypothetical protein IM568_13350 [Flavobacterium sp.]|nr:hypothetical protein [Flavobacterium sp.]